MDMASKKTGRAKPLSMRAGFKASRHRYAKGGKIKTSSKKK